jgi:hypothetical protein
VQQAHAFTRRRFLAGSAAAAGLVSPLSSASAQTAYPTRPVKVVIPYPPAGGADTVGRILFQKLGEMWGQQFVIDNRGGAGGTIAAAAVAKAERDGYTIMYDATAHSVNPSLYPNLPYDTVNLFLERRRLDRPRAVGHAQMHRAYRQGAAGDAARRAGGSGDGRVRHDGEPHAASVLLPRQVRVSDVRYLRWAL